MITKIDFSEPIKKMVVKTKDKDFLIVIGIQTKNDKIYYYWDISGEYIGNSKTGYSKKL